MAGIPPMVSMGAADFFDMVGAAGVRIDERRIETCWLAISVFDSTCFGELCFLRFAGSNPLPVAWRRKIPVDLDKTAVLPAGGVVPRQEGWLGGMSSWFSISTRIGPSLLMSARVVVRFPLDFPLCGLVPCETVGGSDVSPLMRQREALVKGTSSVRSDFDTLCTVEENSRTIRKQHDKGRSRLSVSE